MKSRKIFTSAAALTVTAALLAGCSFSNSPYEQFTAAIESGDSDTAIRIYGESLDGHDKAEEQATDFMAEFLNQALEDYCSGYKTEEDFNTALATVTAVGNRYNVMSWTIEEDTSTFQTVKKSKKDWARAEEYLADGDYLNAYRYYEVVHYDDTEHYDQATDKMLDSEDKFLTEDNLQSVFQSYADAGDYEGLDSYLTLADDVFPGNDLLEPYVAAAECLYLADTVYTAYPSQDWESIVTAAKAYSGSLSSLPDKQLLSRVENAYTGYADAALLDIYDACSEDSMDLAKLETQQAIDAIGAEDERLTAVNQLLYAGSETSFFGTLTGSTSSNFYGAEQDSGYVWGGDSIDSTGDTAKLLYVPVMPGDTVDIVRETGGAYETISFTLYFCERTEDMSAIVSIRADGTEIYNSGTLEETDTPYSITADISGAQEVTVRIIDGTENSTFGPDVLLKDMVVVTSSTSGDLMTELTGYVDEINAKDAAWWELPAVTSKNVEATAALLDADSSYFLGFGSYYTAMMSTHLTDGTQETQASS